MKRFSRTLWLLIAVWALFVVWVALGVRSVVMTELPAFTAVEQRNGYEVREYPPLLVAQVRVRGSWSQALSDGSRILTDYVSGDNTMPESAPHPQSEKIATYAPIIDTQSDDGYLISAVMPSRYSVATIPRPNNPEILLKQLASASFAVLSFSGTVDKLEGDAHTERLRQLLTADKRDILSTAYIVQYNPPWTPPFLRRNEIMFVIR